MVTGKSLLVEDGLVSADERELGGLDDLAEVVLDWEADVENLAEVGDVSVVSVLSAFAVEASLWLTNDELVSVAEFVRHVGAGYSGQSGEDKSGGVGKHFGGLGAKCEERFEKKLNN